jgi:uncharacterized protein
MFVLIDGYNLLFHSQLVGRGRGQGWLQRARERMFALLASRLPESQLGKVTIVFDASQRTESQPQACSVRGMQIVFASEHPEADDLLEELIRSHSAPKQLLVVSSDLRVQRSGKVRRAMVIDSESFLDRCESGYYLHAQQSQGREKPRRDSVEETSPQEQQLGLSKEEVEFWLKEFGNDL